MKVIIWEHRDQPIRLSIQTLPFLTEDEKQLRIEFCQQSLKRFEEGRSHLVFDIVIGDEPWFYHYDPTTKEQSEVWVSESDLRTTKVQANEWWAFSL